MAVRTNGNTSREDIIHFRDDSEEWIAAIGTCRREQTIPPGFKTAVQLAKQLGLSISHTSHKLTELVRDGKAEAIRVPTKCPQRGFYPVPYYRLKKPE